MDQQDVIEITGKIIYTISITGLIIAVGLVWYKLTGHSPTAIDLVLVFQGATFAGIVGLAYRQGKVEGKIDEFNQKFGLLATDFKASQIEFRKMQSDVAEVKRIVSKKRAAFPTIASLDTSDCRSSGVNIIVSSYPPRVKPRLASGTNGYRPPTPRASN